jgi:predicted RNA-binding Zn-ribbon protein involved in translation (DUF1610 family)
MSLPTPHLGKPAQMLFPAKADAVKKHICPTCGAKITTFRDEASRKEYAVSGMCQTCQDKYFDAGEEEEEEEEEEDP